jgi:hypothetical protein
VCFVGQQPAEEVTSVDSVDNSRVLVCIYTNFR